MQREEIAARLMHFLQEEFPNQEQELTESTDLLEEWFVDSVGIIETALFLERSFNLDIRRADINGTNFRTVAALTRFVDSRARHS
jgi:acyl carrier protein